MDTFLKIESWILKTAMAAMRRLHIGFISENTLRQFVRFGMVGVTNTLVSYVIYVAVLQGFKIAGVQYAYDYIVASVTAFILSVLWSYALNSTFVFKKKRSFATVIGEIAKSYATYGLSGLVVANIILYALVDGLGISAYLSFFLVLVVTVPMNFILNKFWTFKL
jgi:putative flippase GtrA